MKLFSISIALGSAASAQLSSWEGALSDAEALAQPAITDELIASVNGDGASTWVAGMNARFAGATLADVKALCGTKRGDTSTHLSYAPPAQHVELPDEFDWRTDPRAVSCPSVKEVRDQANCGSCWAFGSVEAMTDRICIASNGTITTHLSAQDVTSCCKGAAGMGDSGCGGGIPSDAYQYYKATGIVSGGNYGDSSGCFAYELAPCAHHVNGTKYPACPDEVPTPKCTRKCDAGSSASWLGDKHHGAGGYSVCQQGGAKGACAAAMAQEIYQNGPITGMFFVHQSFTSYTSGVYKKKLLNDPMLGGHAIKIMGFGTEAGQDYWLVANSWNEDWGMDGYFKIARGTNECQIEDAIINGGPVAGQPKM